MKKLLFAIGIGAALMWFLDPDAGSRRRDVVKRKLDEKGVTRSSSSVPPSVPTSVTDYTAPASVASIP
jgi:hypothetical protein